ncbi:hypothetical protein ABIB35_000912 [Arthrobacter sp. UYP6]|uniref:hypothetical protein n=1 Tax=Arthrobacter sp. UYP6 TaxID=1756378 RepID=UPI00339243CC
MVAASGESLRTTVTAGDRPYGDRTYEVLTVRRGGDVVQAAVDTHEATEQLRRLSLALVVSVLVSVLAAGLVAGAFSAIGRTGCHAADGRGAGPAATVRGRRQP